MDFNSMTDKQIIKYIADSIEDIRISKQISAEDMANRGGYNAQSYSNFYNKNTNIKLETLIQMFRGIKELHRLQSAFKSNEEYSPLKTKKRLPKRVRKKTTSHSRNIVWGDEE